MRTHGNVMDLNGIAMVGLMARAWDCDRRTMVLLILKLFITLTLTLTLHPWQCVLVAGYGACHGIAMTRSMVAAMAAAMALHGRAMGLHPSAVPMLWNCHAGPWQCHGIAM